MNGLTRGLAMPTPFNELLLFLAAGGIRTGTMAELCAVHRRTIYLLRTLFQQELYKHG